MHCFFSIADGFAQHFIEPKVSAVGIVMRYAIIILMILGLLYYGNAFGFVEDDSEILGRFPPTEVVQESFTDILEYEAIDEDIREVLKETQFSICTKRIEKPGFGCMACHRPDGSLRESLFGK